MRDLYKSRIKYQRVLAPVSQSTVKSVEEYYEKVKNAEEFKTKFVTVAFLHTNGAEIPFIDRFLSPLTLAVTLGDYPNLWAVAYPAD